MVRRRVQNIYIYICVEPSRCSLYALQIDESMTISDTVTNKMVSQEYMAWGNADSSAIERKDRRRHWLSTRFYFCHRFASK